jgi:hypothetical protein
MARSSPRARRHRREQDRALGKTVRRTQRLATELPGGAPERAIEIAATTVAEVRARATPCIHCAGELEIRRDSASSTPRGVLREIELLCRRCHAPRILWFRVVGVTPN